MPLVTDMSPLFKWTLAVIAGGGAAGLVQGGTMVMRGASSVTTAGFGNPLVATTELVLAAVISVLSLLAPVFLAVVVLLGLIWMARKLWLRSQTRVTAPGHPTLS